MRRLSTHLEAKAGNTRSLLLPEFRQAPRPALFQQVLEDFPRETRSPGQVASFSCGNSELLVDDELTLPLRQCRGDPLNLRGEASSRPSRASTNTLDRFLGPIA
jgi:hypothetical protein